MRHLTVVSRPIEDPGPLLERLPAVGGLAWVQGKDGLVGVGEALRIEAGIGPERVGRAAAAFAELAMTATVDDRVAVPGSGLVAFGSFTFDARSAGSALVIPEVVVGRRGGAAWVTTVGTGERDVTLPPRHPITIAAAADRPRYAGSSMPDVHWLESVATAVDRIRRGELDKVVLARDHAVWSKAPFDPRVLTQRLAARFPGCFTFLVDGLVGASPELLVSRFGSRIESLPLAGTTGRGATPDEDRELGEGLLRSAKDRWEHEVLVREVDRVLSSRCRQLAHGEPFLLQLDNVQHLATRFVGDLPDGSRCTALELAGALHPTPAVGGTPTDRAVELIRELEGMDRGRYAGPVGWVDARGDGEWAIALRCAELSGARARLFAGAGIVADSLPEDELEETRLKLLAMQSAFVASPDAG